jgi:hypothetical protein
MAKKLYIRIRYGPQSRLGFLLAALVLVGLFLGLLLLRTQRTQAARLEAERASSATLMRQFYLTKTGVTANQATTACAAGYHMASLWEILDPSNLKYSTALGESEDDSGQGPPDIIGWARTGWSSEANFNEQTGQVNCNAWTSSSNTDWGTYIYLEDNWNSSFDIDPWSATKGTCDSTLRVWCVQDEVQVYHQVFLPQVVRE